MEIMELDEEENRKAALESLETEAKVLLEIKAPEQPSAFAKSMTLVDFKKRELHIRRPGDMQHQPIELLWDGFRLFREEFESVVPATKDYALTLNLAFEMSVFYKTEDERHNALRPILQEHFGSTISSSLGIP